MILNFLFLIFGDFFRIFKILNKTLRWRSLWIFTLMVFQGLLELAFIVSLTYMGIALADPIGLQNKYIFKFIFLVFPGLKVWASDPRCLLILAGLIVVIASAIKSFVSYFAYKKMYMLSEDVSIRIGYEIMERFLFKDYAWHLSSDSAETFQRMMWRTNLSMMLVCILSMYSSVLTMTILFSSLVSKEPVLSSIVLITTVCFGVALYRKIRQSVDRFAEKAADAVQKETSAVLCATKGIREVLIYGQQDIFLKAIDNAAEMGKIPRINNILAPSVPTWVLEGMGFGVMVAAIVYLVLGLDSSIQRITAALSLLLLTAWRVLPYCNRIVGYQISIRAIRPMALSVLEVLEGLRHTPLILPCSSGQHIEFNSKFDLVGVRFRYPGAKHFSLDGINLSIKKGSKIGIVGVSGAGKSTLVGVLSGLLPPSEGHIALDGKKIDDAERAAFARKIGFVPQNPFLFAGTLAENIAFSQWGRSWDEDKVRIACRRAAIDFIDNHPLGVEMPIGENGAGLSGGQAQRVSIARALYADPAIVIFDEATSSLDQGNEDIILNTIKQLPGEVTSIMIAHRLTTLELCDLIVWIDKGRVVDAGCPETILGKYRNAYCQ